MPFTRRNFLKAAAFGSAAAVGTGLLKPAMALPEALQAHSHGSGHGRNMAMGSTQTSDFDPYKFLTDFNWGDKVTPLPDGTMLREYTIEAIDKMIEIIPGVQFPAWTYNGQVPGPTIRAREGDTLHIRFINKGSHPHTIHFHGVHDAAMDGVPGTGPGEIGPGGEFIYKFKAEPYGVHLYHCHSAPLKRHIHKGLYGAYIVDPKEGWGDPAKEIVLVMNAFDTDFDDENEVYAVNTKAFCYAERPIQIKKNELVRAFVVNITEFDAVNSFHLHGNFFNYWEIGHKSNPKRFTDNVSFIQGERGLLEFKYDRTGQFMFHAHQSEFVELGWMSLFEVTE